MFRRLTASVVVGAVLCFTPALASDGVSTAGIDTRQLPQPLFRADSFWTTPLPDRTPLDPNSARVVADLKRTAEAQFGAPGKPHLSFATKSYSPTVYVARNSDPVATFRWNDCMGLGSDSGLIDAQLRGIRIPRGAVSPQDSDGHLTIYNTDTDTYTDLWRARKLGEGFWSVCWGGTIREASTSDGRFSERFGATATGLAMLGGMIRPEELATGEINHVLGICLPYAKPQAELSWPALRGDGKNPRGLNVPAQGQRFRLPADLDIDGLKLSPTARAVAKAAQKYGIIVWDTSAAVHFRAVNVHSLKADPYLQLFRNRYGAEEILGDPAKGEDQFPFDKLQLLPRHYGKDSVTAPPAPSRSALSRPAPRAALTKPVRRTAATTSMADHRGRVWRGRDKTFRASWFSSLLRSSKIRGTRDRALYMTSAKDIQRVSLPETGSGTFKVTLHFVEDYYSGLNERLFHVTAEGARVMSNLDVFKASGAKGRAYTRSFTTHVKDGQLDIGFIPVKQVTTLSAVSVEPVK